MRTHALFLLPILVSISALADELILPESSDPAPITIALPHRGESMSEVARHFGAPRTKLKPVGGESIHQPPITRWEYGSFIVYFENSHVIKAVVPDHPPAISHIEKLQPES